MELVASLFKGFCPQIISWPPDSRNLEHGLNGLRSKAKAFFINEQNEQFQKQGQGHLTTDAHR